MTLTVPKIGLASENPTKIVAARRASEEVFGDKFEFVAYKTDSGVSDQPLGYPETHRGAQNRAKAVLSMDESTDIALGLEGGIVQTNGEYRDVGVVYALGRNGVTGLGLFPGYVLPQPIVEAVLEGQELSEVVAELYGTDTVRDRDCSVVITNGELTAAEFYRQPTVLALRDYQKNLQQLAA